MPSVAIEVVGGAEARSQAPRLSCELADVGVEDEGSNSGEVVGVERDVDGREGQPLVCHGVAKGRSSVVRLPAKATAASQL